VVNPYHSPSELWRAVGLLVVAAHIARETLAARGLSFAIHDDEGALVELARGQDRVPPGRQTRLAPTEVGLDCRGRVCGRGGGGGCGHGGREDDEARDELLHFSCSFCLGTSTRD
jgi:hypothetical protein